MSNQTALHQSKTTYARELRARRFAHGIIGMINEFIPSNRDCYRAIYYHLYELGYNQNVEIISVPPEMDTLNALEFEKAMLERAFKVVTPDGDII